MHARTARLLAAIAIAIPIFPAQSAAQEGIRIADFMGTRSMSLTATSKPVRRGETSTLTIAKNFIDLVPLGSVDVVGADKLSASNGRNSGGTGFVRVEVRVSSTATVGGEFTVRAGSDVFRFGIVRRGLVNTPPTFSPNPSTITFGTTWTMNVTGDDLEGARPSIAGSTALARCHTFSTAARADGSGYVMTVTPQPNNTFVNGGPQITCRDHLWNNEGTYQLSHSTTNSQDPPSIGTASGALRIPVPNYIPKTAQQSCTSNPNLPTPIWQQPANGAVIRVSGGSSTTTSVFMQWSANGVTPPADEWIVSITPVSALGVPLTIGTQRVRVTGTTMNRTLNIGSKYQVSVRASNCDQASPSSQAATFQIVAS